MVQNSCMWLTNHNLAISPIQCQIYLVNGLERIQKKGVTASCRHYFCIEGLRKSTKSLKIASVPLRLNQAYAKYKSNITFLHQSAQELLLDTSSIALLVNTSSLKQNSSLTRMSLQFMDCT